MEPTLLFTIIAAFLVAVIGAFLFFNTSKSPQTQVKGGKRGNTMLLTGQMNSGKTSLFYYLKTGQQVDSVTSLQPNFADFIPACPELTKQSLKSRQYYDLPGHGTFSASITKVLPTVNTIIFTLDSTSISSLPTAAQTLYFYLTNQYIINTKIPIVISCTKTDASSTLPISKLKLSLQDEIEKIRKANSAFKQLESLGDENPLQQTQKLPDETFSFQKTPVSVDWVNISVKNQDISELAQYI